MDSTGLLVILHLVLFLLFFMVVSVFCAMLGSPWILAVGYVAPSLEWEVQRNVYVHSSSCGAPRVVVHSPCCTIDAIASVVASYSSPADCPGSATPVCCESVCVAMSCGGWFLSPGGAYDSI